MPPRRYLPGPVHGPMLPWRRHFACGLATRLPARPVRPPRYSLSPSDLSTVPPCTFLPSLSAAPPQVCSSTFRASAPPAHPHPHRFVGDSAPRPSFHARPDSRPPRMGGLGLYTPSLAFPSFRGWSQAYNRPLVPCWGPLRICPLSDTWAAPSRGDAGSEHDPTLNLPPPFRAWARPPLSLAILVSCTAPPRIGLALTPLASFRARPPPHTQSPRHGSCATTPRTRAPPSPLCAWPRHALTLSVSFRARPRRALAPPPPRFVRDPPRALIPLIVFRMQPRYALTLPSQFRTPSCRPRIPPPVPPLLSGSVSPPLLRTVSPHTNTLHYVARPRR